MRGRSDGVAEPHERPSHARTIVWSAAGSDLTPADVDSGPRSNIAVDMSRLGPGDVSR